MPDSYWSVTVDTITFHGTAVLLESIKLKKVKNLSRCHTSPSLELTATTREDS